MAFMEIHFFSEVLNVASSVNVIMPEPCQGIGVETGEVGKLPQVLYLLHGYSDDQTIWMRRTSIERYAAGHNLAVIMPFVNHSFYMNEPYGQRYWDYISNELPMIIQRFLRISDKPEDTYVAGLSMGGYGAMKLALNYPERFAAAASFSGTYDLLERIKLAQNGSSSVDLKLERLIASVDGFSKSDGDLFHLLQQNAKAVHKPRLFVVCGTEDFLFEAHNKFYPALIENKWDVTHLETPNFAHSWDYWDMMIQRFIREYIR